MGFWFYDKEMLSSYCISSVNDDVKRETVAWLVSTEDVSLPDDIEYTLNEISCLQFYLLSKRPKIIDIGLYTGMGNTIVTNCDAFYYVDKINDDVIIRGIAAGVYIRCDVKLNEEAYELKPYLLNNTVKNANSFTQDVAYILSKFVARDTIRFSPMSAF